MKQNKQSKIIYLRKILQDNSKLDIEKEVARKELLKILGGKDGDNKKTKEVF